jgi:Sec-independent protein translocase protein TatA
LAKINNITQFGFNDYLNSGKYDSIAQTSVNASNEFKAMMRQMDQDQKDAEEKLEADSAKAEEMQAAFNKAQRDEVLERNKELKDSEDLFVNEAPGAVQIESEAVEHLKNQKLYDDGFKNLIGSFASEGDAAERALEEGDKPAPVSKPVVHNNATSLVQK